MTANEYTSLRSSLCSFLRPSGAIHSGVPPGALSEASPEASPERRADFKRELYFNRLIPKSDTFSVQCASTRRFAGFRS